MIDIQRRILIPCPKFSDGHHFDVWTVVENLLLFDEFILKSDGLEEIPDLLETFGFHGLITLLQSKCLKFYCERIMTSAVTRGQTIIYDKYNFEIIAPRAYEFFVSRFSEVLGAITSINQKQKTKIQELVEENLVDHPPSAAQELHDQLKSDLLSQDSSLKLSICGALKRENRIADPTQIKIEVELLTEAFFKISSNIPSLIRGDKRKAHDIIVASVIGVGRRNLTILDMKNFNSLTGFRNAEIPVFESKLDFLAHQLDPTLLIHSLRRILEIRDFPSLSQSSSRIRINVNKLLKIRQSRECSEFRAWLKTLDQYSDQEITRYLYDIKHLFGKLVRKPGVKVFRFLVGTGIGLIPGIGAAASAGYGAIDTFVLENILPTKGAITFLDEKLPTIYR